MGSIEAMATHDALRPRHRIARIVLAVYIVALGLIAFWPSPVDGGARPFLRLVTQAVPILTYARIEFAANILLFVPLGVLLALILAQRHLIVPLAVVTSLFVESLQALLLDQRTPSVLDIVANISGACIGLLAVSVLEWVGRRSA